ncbi:STAS domain-containing protein [Streptosporangiaceae bacterium NEAU-GS5]|nr:STAS domain-containing protein [Streptosporangiaceae bacterium NEAU-GS5]
MRFSLSRHSVGDRVVTLTPVGEVDLLTAGVLRAAIEDTLLAPHPVDVAVDLAGVTFLDCAGIGALIAGRNIAIRRVYGHAVVNPQRQVRRWTLAVSCSNRQPRRIRIANQRRSR